MKFDGIKQQKQAAMAYAGDQIRFTVNEFGTREGGSVGEKKTAEHLHATLTSCCDDVKMEAFNVAPAAYDGWLYISLPCVMLAYVAYFFSTLVAVVMLAVAFIPYVVQHLANKRALDLLYQQKQSQNIFATKKCEGELKKRIVFTANYDAAAECSVAFRVGGVVYIITKAVSLLGANALLALSIARWISIGGVGAGIAQGAYLTVGLAFLIFVPSFISGFFYSNRRRIVDGANSNLTGTYLLVALLKVLQEGGERLQNTDICILLTGSKEVGNRGAKAFCDAHNDEFNDVETVFVTVDTLREKNLISANSYDARGAVKCSKKVQDLVLDSASSARLKVNNGKQATFYVTDVAEFVNAGFDAVSVTAISKMLPSYYHTRYDSYDNLSLDCVGDCFDLAVAIIEKFSGEGEDAKL